MNAGATKVGGIFYLDPGLAMMIAAYAFLVGGYEIDKNGHEWAGCVVLLIELKVGSLLTGLIHR